MSITTKQTTYETKPRVSTILWGLSVMLIGGIALAVIVDTSIDASWALIAMIGLAGVGFLALAATGMRRPPSNDSASPSLPSTEPLTIDAEHASSRGDQAPGGRVATEKGMLGRDTGDTDEAGAENR